MDLVTQTSLEALLLKATSSSNQNIDTAAVEAFCTLINKEKDGAHVGVKVIANRLHSGVEKEVLQTLNILDSCMGRCGTHFQAEVGKFRFLNEMIKLVSPKYLGSQTPIVVKQKVLQLLYVWTLDFRKETKIKEAYDMLRKQGVIREIPNPNVAVETESISKKRVCSIFQDEEKSKILQKLLQSKDPEDVQAANWLIKSMVKEDEKRVEVKSRKLSELESAQNNIRLLNEMLDSYIAESTSTDELDLIKELYQSCERLRPNLTKLAQETSQNEEILGDIIQINDELTHVFSKYRGIIIGGRAVSNTSFNNAAENDLTLLNFDSLSGQNEIGNAVGPIGSQVEQKSSIDVLCDLLDASHIPNSEVLQPIQLKTEMKDNCEKKFKALDDLDILGDHLRKENLSTEGRKLFSCKSMDKVPMNLLPKKHDLKQSCAEMSKADTDPLDFDLSVLMKSHVERSSTETNGDIKSTLLTNESIDDCLVDITEENNPNNQQKQPPMVVNGSKESNNNAESDLEKPKTDLKLKDITVELKDIRPSTSPPVTIMNKNQIKITLHYAKDKPRDDVLVFVVTTVSKNELPLSNYLFQAIAPKSCRLKLQQPSGTDLPAFNPFLPPAAITQIMLIANPMEVQLSLKFVLSYFMDEETVTEMGEVENL